MEIWKAIDFCKGYEVSTFGNVRNINTNKTLKQNYMEKGYKRVALFCNGKRKWLLVHRLVAQTFIDNPENKLEVNHINFIKDDNRVENLEWVTRKENVKHTCTNDRDYRFKVMRINPNDNSVKYYKSISDTEQDGFSKGLVSMCINNKRKTHKGFYWRKV